MLSTRTLLAVALLSLWTSRVGSFSLGRHRRGVPVGCGLFAASDSLLPSSSKTKVLEELRRLVSTGDNTTLVTVQGLVTKRRKLGSSLVFLDIVPLILTAEETATAIFPRDGDNGSSNTTTTVQVLLRRDYFDTAAAITATANEYNNFDVYKKVLQPGCICRLQGPVGPSRNPGEVLLFANTAVWLRPNANPQHLKGVLQQLLMTLEQTSYASNSGDTSLPLLAEVAAALELESDQLQARLENVLNESNSNGDDAVYQLAKDLLAQKQQQSGSLWDPAQLMGSSNRQKVDLLPVVPEELLTVPSTLLALDNEPTAEPTSPYSVRKVLANLASHSNDGLCLPRTTTVVAWVQNRRRYQAQVAVLGVVDVFAAVLYDDKTDPQLRLKCVLHPDLTTGNLTTIASLAATGSRVLLRGCIDRDAPTPTYWVTGVRLLRSSWRPKAVRHLLEMLYNGHVDTAEAGSALEISEDQAAEIVETKQLTKRQWMAAEISCSLQGANSRVGVLSTEMKDALERHSGIREAFPLNQTQIIAGKEYEVSQSDSTTANSSALWISTPGSRWQRTKRPQLEWMIAQIQDVIQSHPAYGTRRLQVVDVGGGKGYLANLVAEELSDVVEVRVVDISARAINNGMMRARRRNLDNIKYDVGDATATDIKGVDVIVALHACGGLSDVAIGHAVSNGAAFVVCPCCFRSNPHLRVAIPDTQQLVSVSNWLQTDTEDVEALQQLAELQGDLQMTSKAIHSICGLRAAAAQHFYGHWSDAHLAVQLKTFPVSFSTRNFCIVGKVTALRK